MDDALDLVDYLPVSFRTSDEQEYISFLWEVFEINQAGGKYQFAFLAYHMLMMSFVYFNIWQIRQTRPTDFKNSLVGFPRDENYLLSAVSPFVFSRVNESIVLRFLRLIACGDSEIATYSKFVKDRNSSAHSNGKIFCKDRVDFENQIYEVLRVVEEIQINSNPLIEQCYKNFLRDSHDVDEREHLDADNQIREVLVRGNYLSQKDIEFCINTDIADLEHAESGEITALHRALFEAYAAE